jgi:DNA topoisomerase-2
MSNDTKKYGKLSQREHILLRPDTYVGSNELSSEELWVYDEKEEKIIKKLIKYNPALLKIFDEALVNASDASVNDKSCDNIKVEYNKEEGYISVENNGENGIPVEAHHEHKTLVPSMIFGELLTSSNFDDDQERTTGGRNGIGIKLNNIFSSKFVVEIVDMKRKKKFYQEWTNNMEKACKAKVTDITAKNAKPYIKVIFYPDFKRFGIENLNNDHYELFHRRVIDIAGISGNRLKVYFNDNLIKANTFKSYIDLHYPNETVYFDESNERWTVGVLYKQDSNNDVISFVNSINTYRGGTHANHVMDNIIKTLINDNIKKKEKELKISPQLLKDNLVFFINSTLINPTFSSQTKDTCTSKLDKFGSKYIPQPAFLKKLAKCGIVEQIIELVKFKESSSLKKTDGKKQVRIKGIPKLDDANKAGSKDSYKCSLILTEGDSAKAFAISGLSIVGRDYFGVFPLKGKLLNVREATPAQLLNNEEINSLKQIMGLKHGEDYSDEAKFKQLRYGRIIILTDADVDGSHIKGLVMNFVHSIWPSLIKKENFITSLATPIVKAFKGNEILTFYNLTDYDSWVEKGDNKNYKIKYYKGLGTSTSQEAKEYFVDIEDKLISYLWTNQIEKEKDDSEDEDEKIEILPYETNNDEDAILLAFDKTRADDRKIWLQNYDKNNVLLYENKSVSYYKFVHSDLIHFSNDDLGRSIPSLVDGLKPSQRKVLFGAYLRGLDKTEVKVAQLAGFVSDKAAYHHGEASLMGAIIGMAQNYVGSNNINILKPNGNFGGRIRNGKDAASPRYIWTKLEDLTCIIFNPADEAVLNNQLEDNEPIEPEYYAPIIPMILVNGAEGIGTGYSTKIPCYDPKEIIDNLKNRLLKGKQFKDMEPFWYGFEGIIAKVDNNNYEMYGTYQIDDNKLLITELPIGESIDGYKEFLEKLLDPEEKKIITPLTKSKTPVKKIIKKDKEVTFIGYLNKSTDTKIYFELEFVSDYLKSTKDIDKQFRLVKKFSTTNMHLFDVNGTIKKYDGPVEIMNEFYVVRYKIYEKRKQHELDILEYQLKLISYKVKFILLIIEKKLVVNNKKKCDIEEELEKLKFPKIGKNKDDIGSGTFNYLLGMPIYNLTTEKIEELKNQQTEKETEYNELENTTIETLWLNELNKLEKEYDKWLIQRIKTDKGSKKLKKLSKTI